MSVEPTSGQKVRWNNYGDEARGEVVETVTSPTPIKSRRVAAADDPDLIVETDDRERAAHQAGVRMKG